MEDLTIRCIQCGDEFIFTAGEQSYYEEHGFSHPKRCPECRKSRVKIGDGTQWQKNLKKRNE